MKGFVINIEKATLDNANFRHVLYTGHHAQLVVMSLKPGEDIGEEVHDVDQFLRCEQGQGKSVLNGVDHEFSDGYSVVVPAGVKHNIINTSPDLPLKLYTVYAPPNHIDGTIHSTKADAEAAEQTDHFDGKTSE